MRAFCARWSCVSERAGMSLQSAGTLRSMPAERHMVAVLLVFAIGWAGFRAHEHERAREVPEHGEHVIVYRPSGPLPVQIELVTRMVVSGVATPLMTRGGRRLSGDINITETHDARLLRGDLIRFRVEGARLRGVPVVTTNTASDLAVVLTSHDDEEFVLRVTAPSRRGSLGVITVSSIAFEVAADAPPGPVVVAVRGFDWSGTVSNAVVTD